MGTDTQHSVGGFSSLQYSARQTSTVGSCRCTYISKHCAGDICCGGYGIGSSGYTAVVSFCELDCRNCLAPGGGCIAQLKQLTTDHFSWFAVIMRNISLIKKCHIILMNCINIKVYNLLLFHLLTQIFFQSFH